MATYRVYLTEKADDSPHPVETVDLIGGLTTSAAFEMCFALNEGGKLRDGIEAHFATEDTEAAEDETEYLVWGEGQSQSLRNFTTRDATLEETDGIERRWHISSDAEGAETWATVVTGTTDTELGAAVAFDANVWGFCSTNDQEVPR